MSSEYQTRTVILRMRCNSRYRAKLNANETTDEFGKVWECGNCYKQTPRQTRISGMANFKKINGTYYYTDGPYANCAANVHDCAECHHRVTASFQGVPGDCGKQPKPRFVRICDEVIHLGCGAADGYRCGLLDVLSGHRDERNSLNCPKCKTEKEKRT